MTVWVIRAGKHGENEQFCLSQGVAAAGWDQIGDMSSCKSREDVRALIDAAYPSDSSGRRSNATGQLWGLLNVKAGDLVILPLKTTKMLALGVAVSGYKFRVDAPQRHTVGVDWKRDDVPRSAIKDDLLFTLGAIMTIFKASRNEAERRFRIVINTGIDPGALAVTTGQKASKPMTSAAVLAVEPDDTVTDPVAVPTLETIRDRVRTHIAENFGGHGLSNLVAAILRARGFVCDVSPPGPDQGVDILAGSGPLGLNSPTLIVEVKSETSQVSAPVVRGLQGAMLSNRSDQGLLVAWGGITKDAKREIRTDRLTMRVWDADDLLDQLFEVYDRLPDQIRSAIPFKRAWVLNEEAG